MKTPLTEENILTFGKGRGFGRRTKTRESRKVTRGRYTGLETRRWLDRDSGWSVDVLQFVGEGVCVWWGGHAQCVVHGVRQLRISPVVLWQHK